MDRSRLGPYEIRDKLGEGGMGEVYLADDTRLGRQVAIKVLPAEFASDAERLARFEQEARAAAALNHPHIAAIHDVGADDGVHYMVQEYLQGQTLGDEIAERRMPLERALELGVEIAEALGAAHGAGIVHRDLKPANIFVTEQGHAKILDFGLAKLADLTPVGSADDSKTQSPTMLGTVAGQVMGTAGYMAPEQVGGGDIDGRTDVFAFGCVLYEMLVGKRPFSGRSIMQTLDLIVHEDPAPLGDTRKGMPARLQWVLDKCLAKDPKRRYQDAEDLVVDLRWVAQEEAEDATGAAGQPGAHTRARGIPVPIAAIAGVILVVAAALLSGSWTSGPAGESRPVMRLGFALPSDVMFTNVGRRAVTINRQGTMIAFSADEQVWTRPLSDIGSAPLRGTENGGRAAAFSPDGRDVVFWSDGELRRVPVSGGTPVVVTTAQNPWGLRWPEDEWLLYGQGPEGIWRVRAGGGEPEQVIAMTGGWLADGPQFIDENRILYTRRPPAEVWDNGEIVLHTLGEVEPEVLAIEARDGRWLAEEFLIYARGSDVYARRWDGTGAATLGPAAPVASSVQSAREITGAAHLDLADDGTLAYIPGDVSVADRRRIVWADRAGNTEVSVVDTLLGIDRIALSTAATRVAVSRASNTGAAIWVYDLRSGAGSNLTSEGFHGAPVWSPDDRWIYYTNVHSEGDYGDVYRVSADGSGSSELVLAATSEREFKPASVATDGGRLLIDSKLTESSADRDVLLLDIERDELTVVVDEAGAEFNARISPDGRYVAYAKARVSDMGVSQLQIRDLVTGATYPVTADNAAYARWSADGTELFYAREGLNESDAMVALPVTAGERLEFGASQELFRLDTSLGTERDFQVVADGSRFLYSELPGNISASIVSEILVVVNWIDLLEVRVPER